MKPNFAILAAAAAFLVGPAAAQPAHPAQDAGPATERGMSGMSHRGRGMSMGMGMLGMGHGSATMAERADIHGLLISHAQVRRTVTNLPNGIRTVTESDDPEVARAIKQHVRDMAARLEEGRDPGMPIESAALRSLFPARARIKSAYTATDNGYVVTQTSADPAVVRALQSHAAEVSDLASRGMAAAHEAMMKNRHGAGVGAGGAHRH